MSRKPKATKIKDLDTYAGDVSLFHLSKGLKKGSVTIKYIVVSRSVKPGAKNTTFWYANENGAILTTEPVAEFSASSIEDALGQFGYEVA